MIRIQTDFTKPTESVTPDCFNEVVDSVVLYRKIQTIRLARKEAAQLADSRQQKEPLLRPESRVMASSDFQKWRAKADADLPADEQLMAYADYLKRSLQAFVFVASFFEPTAKEVTKWVKGKKQTEVREAEWRKQSAAHLNGLAVLDADHLDFDIREWYRRFTPEQLRQWGIVFIFITSSGEGVKVVFKARLEWGDLIQNCIEMGKLLGLPVDESGKDASRMSFAPSRKAGDILYLDQDGLLNYENSDYETRYGEAYRSQGSSAKSAPAAPSSSDVQMFSTTVDLGEYKGVGLQLIVDALLGGKTPTAGKRHNTSLWLADMLRYIIDDVALIETVLQAQPWVQEIVRERGENVAQTVRSALSYRREDTWPLTLRKALAKAGVEGVQGIRSKRLDHVQWAEKSKRLNLGCYAPAVAHIVNPEVRPGGIITSSVMYGTLLTRCTYLNWEGELTRINSKGLIIGPPTSGKGFAVRQDEIIMAVMREQDSLSRADERTYKESLKERATSSRELKKKALKRPEGIIRYLPVKTSNAVLYRRMLNAVERDTPDAEPYYLHVYMFGSELLTFVNASGNFQEKRDILLQSHSNERNGVDYANADSVNDTLPMFFNCVFTGTNTALDRMINLRNVGDGLSTRFSCFVMPTGEFRMRPYRRKPADHTADDDMRIWSHRFDSLRGEIKGLERLTRHVYEMVASVAEEAAAQGDSVTQTFCMRMQDKVMAACIPQVISTQPSWEELQQSMTVTITRQHLAFADFIFDVLLHCEEALFGQLWQDAFESEEREKLPRVVADRTSEFYARLPEEFTTADVKKLWGYSSNTTASTRISKFLAEKEVEKIGHGRFRKLVARI